VCSSSIFELRTARPRGRSASFTGFLHWRFAYADPRCAPRHLHRTGNPQTFTGTVLYWAGELQVHQIPRASGTVWRRNGRRTLRTSSKWHKEAAKPGRPPGPLFRHAFKARG
jgi:hypothetical protein